MTDFTPAPRAGGRRITPLLAGLIVTVALIIVTGCLAGAFMAFAEDQDIDREIKRERDRTPAVVTAAPTADARIGAGPVIYNDGVSVEVLTAARYTPSPSGAPDVTAGDTPVRVTVRVTNNADQAYNLAEMTVLLRLTAGDNPSDWDVQRAILDDTLARPTHALAPGDKATAAFAFSVDPRGLGAHRLIYVEVWPGWNYDAALFQGAAA